MHRRVRSVVIAAILLLVLAGCAEKRATIQAFERFAGSRPQDITYVGSHKATGEGEFQVDEFKGSAGDTETPRASITATPPRLPIAGDIHIRSGDGWEAWTHSTDFSVVQQEWMQYLYVRQPQGDAALVWRVSEDIRQKYYRPVAWAPGTHLILAGKGAICNSCWSWGVPLATINAETGQVTDLDAAMLLTSEGYAFSPSQPGLLAIAQGGSRYLLDGMRLALLDLTTGQRRDLTDPAMTAFEPSWSPDSNLIAYAAVRAVPNATGDGPTLDRLLNGRAIYIINPATGESRALTQPGEQAMDGWPHWTADGSHLLYARRYDDRTEVHRISLDGKTDELLTTLTVSPMCNYAGCAWPAILDTVPPAKDPIYRLAWSPDSKTIAAATQEGIALYDGTNLSPLWTINSGGAVESLAYSPDGARLACTCGEGVIKIWDVKSGQLLKNLTDEKGFTSVAFSPSGADIAGGTRNGSVKVFDAQSEKLLLTLPGPEGDVDALAYTPDGKQILAGSSLTGTVKGWDASSGQALHAFLEYSEFFGIVFSPDGTRMASSNVGGDSIKVWDLQSGSLVTTLAPLEVVRFAFSADGKSIICACRQGLLAWDAGNGTPQGQFPNDTSDVYSMALSPDGMRLAVGTREGRIKIVFWASLSPLLSGTPATATSVPPTITPTPSVTPRPDASALVPCPGRSDTDKVCLPDGTVRLVGSAGVLGGYPILNRGTGKSPVLLNDSAGNPYTDLLREPNRLVVVEGTLMSIVPPTISVIRHYSATGAPGSETWLPELYTNSQVGFAIQYPSSWIVEDDTATSGGIVSIQNYHSADLPLPALVDPALYKVEIVPIMPSQATTLAEMRGGVGGQVVREQAITINNLSAIWLTVDTESHGRTEILLAQLPDRVLLVQTWQAPAFFEHMVETLRLSNAPAVPADAILTWKREVNGQCATAVIDARGRAGFGPCSAPDRFSFILPEVERQKDLQHFLERYQPFESATPEGEIVFKGRGSQVASPAEQRAIADWAGLVEQELEYGRSGASWGMALAIVQDRSEPCLAMGMQRSGQFAAQDCRIGLESDDWRWMTAEQLAQLYAWLDTFRGFEAHFTDDDQRVRFVFSGQGLNDATPAEQEAIFDWAKAVYRASAGK